ncbi:MAG: glycoside hydrolase family 97 N-terminal domain-containing protein [Dinghuibacter sp.]|nr:glycoside hydrolase family 97 N-terminal domain-containing protein [Dinghuibacter sp.]
MKKIVFVLLALLPGISALTQTVYSPNKNLQLVFSVNAGGAPQYGLFFKGNEVVKNSSLGLMLKGNINLQTALALTGSQTKTVNETWQPVLGEQKNIVNNYTELEVRLKQRGEKPVEMIVRFRLFNEGLGFRYEFLAGDFA